MIPVCARRFRKGDAGTSIGPDRVYVAFLVSVPEIGSPMVLLRDATSARIVTTPVVRLLGDLDTGVLYVETERSVYRVARRRDVLT